MAFVDERAPYQETSKLLDEDLGCPDLAWSLHEPRLLNCGVEVSSLEVSRIGQLVLAMRAVLGTQFASQVAWWCQEMPPPSGFQLNAERISVLISSGVPQALSLAKTARVHTLKCPKFA